jgi:hypothetical protein
MSKDVQKLLDRVGRQQEELRALSFIAPALKGDQVAVRLPRPSESEQGETVPRSTRGKKARGGAGLVCRFQVDPSDFSGWGVFKAEDGTVARLERAAGLAEIERYLRDLPQHRLLLAEEPGTGGPWWGVPATEDQRLEPEGLYPVGLVENVALFDACLARFDGARFWFEGLDTSRDPALPAYLRDRLSLRRTTDELARPGLGRRELRAYGHALEVAETREALTQRGRLIKALGHPGARLTEFSEHGDEVTVRYAMNGSEHTVRVRRNDLTVVSAGICLAGRDRDFDLTSLVSVLQESIREYDEY